MYYTTKIFQQTNELIIITRIAQIESGPEYNNNIDHKSPAQCLDPNSVRIITDVKIRIIVITVMVKVALVYPIVVQNS